MKNLVEELHKLDEYQYDVSADFSKKVMHKIQKSKKINKFNNVISFASIGAVACLAVICINHVNVKNNFINSQNEGYITDKNLKNSSMANNDVARQTESIDKASYNDFENIESAGASGLLSFTSETDGFEPGSTEANKTSNTLIDNAVAEKSNKEELASEKNITEVLKKANLTFEQTKEGLKVKIAKKQLEEILKDYQNIALEEQGDYTIIKITK